MLKNLIASLLLFVSSFSFAQEGPTEYSLPDLAPFQELFPGDQLNAGFGLARDMITHVYFGRKFAPRDLDFAVIGANWEKDQAIEILGQYGRVDRTLDMVKEVLTPSGRVFAYHYGFVVIIEHEGVQVDFKFFKSYEDAHTRGLFDVEKILFPLNGRPLETVIEELKIIRQEGRTPGPEFMSDPHNGFESILTNNPKTINWAKAKAHPIDWVIRGAMIYAKLGIPHFLPTELELMRRYISRVQYIMPKERGLFPRAANHPRAPLVKSLLDSAGFFQAYPSWRWTQPVQDSVDRLLSLNTRGLFCRGVF
jgi:hypothetical protein